MIHFTGQRGKAVVVAATAVAAIGGLVLSQGGTAPGTATRQARTTPGAVIRAAAPGDAALSAATLLAAAIPGDGSMSSPPGGPGGSGGTPPTITTAPNGDEVITYTGANGSQYSFQVSASQVTQAEANVWDKLQQGLGRAGQFSNGVDNAGTGYEYVPVLRANSSTPDLLRLEWDNGQLAGVTRVDIYSPGATTSVNNIYSTLDGKQGGQADEVVVDLEGRDKDSILNVVENIGDSMKSDNQVDLQKLDGVRIISDAQTGAPPTVDVTVVRVAGATTDPVPLGLGGVTVTGDAAADNAQAAIADAAAAQLPPEELPAYETPEE